MTIVESIQKELVAGNYPAGVYSGSQHSTWEAWFLWY